MHAPADRYRQPSSRSHSDSDEVTPREGDRYYTPRGSARYGSSSDSEWTTPRGTAGWTSDNEFATPRGYLDSQYYAPAEAKYGQDEYYQTSHVDYKSHYPPSQYAPPSSHYQQPPMSTMSRPPLYPSQQPPQYHMQHQVQHQVQHQIQQPVDPVYGAQPEAYDYGYYDQGSYDQGSYDQYAPDEAFYQRRPRTAWGEAKVDSSYESASGTAPAWSEAKVDSSFEAEPSSVTDKEVEDIFSYARHNRVDEVEKLLDRGIPVNVRDQFGNTILTISCQNGHKRVAKAALRRGADINAKNYKGNTPLHFCFTYGYGDTLGKYMISKGADPSVTNNAGLTCHQGLGR